MKGVERIDETLGVLNKGPRRAAATTVAKLNQLQVAHPHHPLLGYQVPRGVRRTVGADGDWRLSRRDSLTEIDALTATIMAIHEADKDTQDNMQIFFRLPKCLKVQIRLYQ